MEVESDGGETLTARYLLDASGQSTLLGKHLGQRRVLPHLKKIASDQSWMETMARTGSA